MTSHARPLPSRQLRPESFSGQPSAGVEAVLARYQRSLARRGIDPGVALVSGAVRLGGSRRFCG